MAADFRERGNETITLYFGGWYFGLFVISQVLLLMYKAIVLPYPVSNLTSEFLLLFFLTGVEAIRIFLGKKGNLTETILSVVVSLGMTIPSVAGVTYFLLWQTYILRLEVILCSLQLCFQSFQTLFSILALITFARAPSQFG